MRHLVLILTFSVIINNCFSQEPENKSDHIGKQGLWKVTDIPDYSYALITYKDDNKHGPYSAYYDNGILAIKGTFKNDKIEGVVEQYYESGGLYRSTNYVDGKQNGKVKTFFESGEIHSEEYYKDGKLEGIYKEYFKNGNLFLNYQYLDGELDGPYEQYHENGNINSYGNHRKGGKVGDWYFFTSTGDTLKIEVH